MHIYYQTIIYETRHKTTTTTIHHHKTRSRYIQASGLDLYDILRRPTSPTTYLPEPNSICYLPRDITASKREPGLSRDRNHWNIFAKPEIYKNLPLIPINFFFFLICHPIPIVYSSVFCNNPLLTTTTGKPNRKPINKTKYLTHRRRRENLGKRNPTRDLIS